MEYIEELTESTTPPREGVEELTESTTPQLEVIEELTESTTPRREVIDLCLRFPNEDEAVSVLFTDGQSNYRNIDIIGAIYKPTSVMLMVEDREYPEVLPVDGFHVNVRVMPDEDLFTLEPFEVTPESPVRVWA